MKIQQFNGGVSRSLAPHMLELNQGATYININSEVGTLKSSRTPLATGQNYGAYPYFFRTEQRWIMSDTRKSYVEYRDFLYSADGTTVQKYRKADGTNNLGIAPPTVAPTLTLLDNVKSISAAVKTVTTTGNLPTSTLSYILVNVNSAGLYSSALQITVGASTTKSATVNAITIYPPYDYAPETRGAIAMYTDGVQRAMQFTVRAAEVDTKAELYREYEGTYRLVGTFTPTSLTVLDDVDDISASAALNIDMFASLNGTYSYVYTFYNSKDGAESAPSPVSGELLVTPGNVRISNIRTSSDPQVDLVRLYRVGGNVTSFTKVAEFSNGTASYIDKIPDTELSTLLESTTYDAPPKGLNYLVEAYAMLFGAVGSKIYFTPVDKPNAWPATNFLEFAETVTGLGVAANGLLVFTADRTYIVSGTGPTTLTRYLLSGDQGCTSHYSVVNIAGSCLWVSKDGICQSNGGIPAVLTKRLLGKENIQALNAVVHDEVYYVQRVDGTLLALDFRFTPIVKEFDIDTSYLVVAKDVLYGIKQNWLIQLFAGDDNLTMQYLSPRFIEGSVTKQKTYKKVFIYSTGVIQLDVFINDVLVATGHYTEADSNCIQVPQDKQRGFYIQFKVTGKGEVLELEYEIGNQNG